MLKNLITYNYYEAVSIIIFGIGFTTLLLNKNMIKKIIGFNFMDTAVYLFLASKGFIEGRVAPIATTSQEIASTTFTKYINPVPAGLVLTGIVVSVSFSAFLLALTVKLHENFHTLDLNEIIRQINEAQEDV